jgi:hypothetical protein
MPVGVPRQRRDALTFGDAEPVERVHELLGPAPEVGVGVAVELAGPDLRHDLGVAEVVRRVREHHPCVELRVHHRHAGPPVE